MFLFTFLFSHVSPATWNFVQSVAFVCPRSLNTQMLVHDLFNSVFTSFSFLTQYVYTNSHHRPHTLLKPPSLRIQTVLFFLFRTRKPLLNLTLLLKSDLTPTQPFQPSLFNKAFCHRALPSSAPKPRSRPAALTPIYTFLSILSHRQLLFFSHLTIPICSTGCYFS